jgi:NitT/TauT family transport system substrate-binding protein
MGFFKKYGLTLQLLSLSSGEAAAAAVAGGSADIGILNALSFAVAHEKGIGLRFIAPASEYVQAKPTVGLVVLRESPIRAPSDLNGKVVAVPAVTDLNAISTSAWLDAHRGQSKTLRFIEMPPPQMPAALQNHIADAAMIATPALTAALEQCCRTIGFPYDAIATRFIAAGWYARGDWIDQHRDVARRFVRAITEAQNWANKNPAESAKIFISVSKIDPSLMAKMTRVTYGQRFTPELLQPLIEFAARYKLLKGSFAANELYETL